MLKGRFWAVSEIFAAIGESFGGSKTKGKGQRHKPAQRRPSGKNVVPDQPQAAAIRKARMRGMLSAIEQGALQQK